MIVTGRRHFEYRISPCVFIIVAAPLFPPILSVQLFNNMGLVKEAFFYTGEALDKRKYSQNHVLIPNRWCYKLMSPISKRRDFVWLYDIYEFKCPLNSVTDYVISKRCHKNRLSRPNRWCYNQVSPIYSGVKYLDKSTLKY